MTEKIYTRQNGTTFNAFRPSDDSLDDKPKWLVDAEESGIIKYEVIIKEKQGIRKKDSKENNTYEEKVITITIAGNSYNKEYDKTVIIFNHQSPEGISPVQIVYASTISKISDYPCHEDEKFLETHLDPDLVGESGIVEWRMNTIS